jgi:hypothetical protein
MSNTARLRLAVAGGKMSETMFPSRPFFLESVGNLPVPHTPPHVAHRPETGR